VNRVTSVIQAYCFEPLPITHVVSTSVLPNSDPIVAEQLKSIKKNHNGNNENVSSTYQ